MELIDKSALVAEIERRKRKLLDHIICERDKEWVVRTAHQLNRIILFINTLEVKGVDLEKEFDEYTQPITAQDIKDEPFTQLFACAQHFYELGIKAKKGE